MNKHKKIWLTLLACLLLTAHVRAQDQFVRSYTVEDGLGNNKITAIVQDWRGYLWTANYGAGITRYNGREFTNYDENDGLSSNRVKCLAFDKYQRLWIGTQGGGVSILQGDRFINFRDSISGLSDYINCMLRASDEVMWIGTDVGLYCYHAGVVQGLSERLKIPDTQVQDIYEDAMGNIWVAFWESGIYCLAPNPEGGHYIVHFDKRHGLMDNSVTKIGPGPNGTTIIGTMHGAQTMTMKAGEEPVFSAPISSVPLQQVYSITEDTLKGNWISFGPDGTYRQAPGETTYSAIDEHEDHWVYTSFIDREHQLWLSLWETSLCQMREVHITSFSESNGIPSRQTSALSKGSVGMLVAGTKGLYRNYKNEFIPLDSGRTADREYDMIHQTKDGSIWLVEDNELVHRTATGWTGFRNFKELLPERITDLCTDAYGTLWMATWNSPVVKFDGSTFSIIRHDSLPASHQYERIIAASDSSIWLGTRNAGAYQLKGNQLHAFPENRLPSGKIVDLTEHLDGSIWLACQDGGVAGIKHGEIIAVIDQSNGIPTRIFSIHADKEGFLWIGTKKGVFVLNLDDVINGNTGYALHISEADGLISEECLPGQLEEDDAGNIWVGTKQGLVKIERDVLFTSGQPELPILHIKDVKINYREVDWKDFGNTLDPVTLLPQDLVLDYDQSLITFDIEAVSMRNRSNVLYRYKMEGQDEDFSPISSSPSITYHDIGPGSYTLLISGCDAQGRCDSAPIRFSFTIMKPFWKTWWFYLIALAIGNALIFAFIRIRERNLIESRRVLEEKVTLRTAEIQSQKKIIEENNRNITDSIRYAKRIQSAMLLSEADVRGVFPGSFLVHLPKDIVSGDFYFSAQSADLSVMAVADCTGHGVPGAVMSMMGYSLFNEAIRKQNITNTARTFDFISESVIRMLRQKTRVGESKDGMDASIIIWNRKTNELDFTGANQKAFVIGDIEFIEGIPVKEYQIDGKTIYELQGDKQPLGINKSGTSDPFHHTKIKVNGTAGVYMMSDGYVDQFGGTNLEAQVKGGKKFKISRLRTMIAAVSDESPDKQKVFFHQELSMWKGPLEQVDDITLVGIRLQSS